MKRFFAALILAQMLAFASSSQAAPLEVYGRLPNIEQVQISPDGRRLAIVVTDGEGRIVTVSDLETGKLVAGGRAGDVKVRAIQWAGSNHLLITTTSSAKPLGNVIASRAEYATIRVLTVDTDRIQLLLEDVDRGLNIIIQEPDIRIIDHKPAVFLTGIRFTNARGHAALFRIDLEDGIRSRVVEPGDSESREWVLDAAGAAIAHVRYGRQTGRWRLDVKSDGAWRTVFSEVALVDPPVLEGLGRDGTSVLVSTFEGDEIALREISPKDAAWSDPLSVGPRQAPIYDPVRDVLIGFYDLVGDEERYTFFDANDQAIWNTIVKAYAGQRVQMVSASADRRKVVVLVDSPTEGPAYALVDLDTMKATWIGPRIKGLGKADVATVRPVNFKAKDGLELSGYLTLPNGRSEKALPLVVLPHGGPASRDMPGFDWWAQALASRGYAVLQVNYRGSTGFGREFLQAGYGQWGRSMQTDLSDGVRYLAQQGVIDPERVCIVGGSYGGYAALAGATIDTGVYRCAASVAGPSDLRKMVEFARARGGAPSQRYWLRFMGVEERGDPALQDISPASLAHRATIPILMVHGKDDTIVPAVQSQIMADALKEAGKPHELLMMKGEDHWLTSGDTRLEMLRAVVAFLEKHNPPT